MSESEVNALLRQVADGAVAAKTAIALMVLNGEDQATAARLTFYALGGSDATQLDEHGRLCYVGSGKLVAEVERAVAAGTSG